MQQTRWWHTEQLWREVYVRSLSAVLAALVLSPLVLLFGAVFGLMIHKPDLVALGAAILASILTLALLLTARRDMPERRWFVAGEIVTLFGLMALLLSRKAGARRRGVARSRAFPTR